VPSNACVIAAKKACGPWSSAPLIERASPVSLLVI
jgi:hypothetical protein